MGAYSSKHQEIVPKVGGGPTFRCGPSFARVRFYSESHFGEPGVHPYGSYTAPL